MPKPNHKPRESALPIPAPDEKVTRRVPRQDTHLDSAGREMPDPTPIAPPLGYKKTPSLAEQIRSMVISEKLRQETAAAGLESFEEADDFEIGDDYDPTSPYEEVFDPPQWHSPGEPAEPSPATPPASGKDPGEPPPACPPAAPIAPKST